MGQEYLFKVPCNCSYVMEVPNNDGLVVNLIGMLQFVCPKCHEVINISHNPMIYKDVNPITVISSGTLNNI